MGFRFRRSVKLFPGIRLNFGKRGISASIGVRGAHVTYGPTGTRTTVGLPGSGLSYTHLQKRHHVAPVPTTAEPVAERRIPPGSAARGVLWIALIVVVVVSCVGRLITGTPPLQTSPPPQAPAQTAAQGAALATEDGRSAQIKRAALGVTQIRRAVANSNTLRLSRVTVMPTGAICYQVRLRNSHGVAYVRTAVMDGVVPKVSGSDDFTALWNRACGPVGGRDVTSTVENILKLSAK